MPHLILRPSTPLGLALFEMFELNSAPYNILLRLPLLQTAAASSVPGRRAASCRPSSCSAIALSGEPLCEYARDPSGGSICALSLVILSERPN